MHRILVVEDDRDIGELVCRYLEKAGFTAELVPWLAGHMDVDAIDATGVPQDLRTKVEELAAENVKRVHRAPDVDPFDDAAQSPYEVTAFVEFKTVWHPMGA